MSRRHPRKSAIRPVIVIWTLALILGIVTVAYINYGINSSL